MVAGPSDAWYYHYPAMAQSYPEGAFVVPGRHY